MDDNFNAFFERLVSVSDIKNQSALARVLGVGRAAVSLAKKKNTVPPRWILDLAVKYNLNTRWLERGEGEPLYTEPENGSAGYVDGEFVHIPKVAARLSAGGGSFETYGEVERFYSFRADWLCAKGDPKNMVLMSVVGNSMEPEIHAGDMVMVDQSKIDIYAGGIYAVGVEDTVLVKRLEKLPGQLVLHSDNRDYEAVYLQGDELLNVRIIGKVLWASREY
ncbi:MAG: LexA family transcriptional regulator [Desulfovibrio sp.]